MEILTLVYIGCFSFFFGGTASVFANPKTRHNLYIFPVIGGIFMAAAGLQLINGHEFVMLPYSLTPYLDLRFNAGPLAGLFIFAVSVLTSAVSVYTIGYAKGMQRGGFKGLFYNLFILSMYAVLFSGNIFTFLVSWETMSIVSYFLVTFDRTESSTIAGLIYALMTHIGTAFIIALFFMLYKYTGTADFDAMKGKMELVPQEIKNIIFLFSLIGFGTKAGVMPLHTWLPRAHPAAPSNVSALMSGVMIKTGIYGFIMIGLDTLGQCPEWWGITVIVVGSVSAVVGILYAIMESDIKRMLAYSSIENIGIIMLGLGASLVFRSKGLNALSSLALLAALYHVLNHSIFKGLLFLSAGSVLHGTQTKDMEKMGGLLKKMPYTGLFFLIGSVSICALPPFNGFVSEWLTYQSLLFGFETSSTLAKIITPLGGAALALTGALAGAGFVKVFGISFLGLPRSEHSANAHESSSPMIWAMGFLAVLCLLYGVFPGIVIDNLLSPVVLSVTGSQMVPAKAGMFGYAVNFATYTPALALTLMLVAFVFAVMFLYGMGGRTKIVYGESWDCGIPALNSRMQYSAMAFTKALRQIFKKIYLPRRELAVSYIVKPFFVRSIRYKGEITPFVEKHLFEPLTKSIHSLAERMRELQSGSLHVYLGYILITLMSLLILLRCG